MTKTKENYKANYDNKPEDYLIDIKCSQAEAFEILDTIRDKFDLSCEVIGNENNKVLLLDLRLSKTIIKWKAEVIELMKKRQKENLDTTYQSGYLQALYDLKMELEK